MSINTAVFPQQGQPIPLGRQGESNARTIVFEIYGWLREYGEGGTFLLLHKRPNDQAAYLVPFTMSPNGTEIFWKVSAVDTDKDTSGSFGEAELRYEITSNGVTVKTKSELYRTMVAKSLGEYNPRYPDVPEPEGGGLVLRPVLERPTIGEENIIYLVPNDASEDPENVYVEWIYVNNAWEEWGKYTADVDIASKADLSYVNAQLELKQDKIPATGSSVKPVYFSSAGTATPIPGYVPDPSDDNPLMDGTASPGTSTDFSRKDHRHPHDSTKQDKIPATGSAVQGVYVSASGEVSAMTYSLNKTVPANAVFTDTTYDPATSSMSGLMSSADKAKLDSIALPAGSISMPVILANQSVANFDHAAAGRPLRVTVHIQPTQSSGTPSPSNPLPIAGWTMAKACRGGKNLLPLTLERLVASNTAGTWSDVDYAANGVTFRVHLDAERKVAGITVNGTAGSGGAYLYLNDIAMPTPGIFSGADEDFVCAVKAGGAWIGPYSTPFSVSGGKAVSDAWFRAVEGANFSSKMYYPMFNVGTQVEPFVPYAGVVNNIAFPSSIGTVYGGTLDVARGLLTVTDRMLTFNGTENFIIYYPSRPTRFDLDISDMPGHTLADGYFTRVPLCSHTPVQSNQITGNSPNTTYRIVFMNSDVLFGITQASLDNVKAFFTQQYNNGTPVQVLYPLATPLTYQLTPQQLVTLAGTNNVFADCGNVTVTHWPETGTPVEPVEDASEIEWKKGILARLEALEAGE